VFPVWPIAIGLAAGRSAPKSSRLRAAPSRLLAGVVVLAFVSFVPAAAPSDPASAVGASCRRSRRRRLLAIFGGDRSVWLKLYDGHVDKLGCWFGSSRSITAAPFGSASAAAPSRASFPRIGRRSATASTPIRRTLVAQWIAEWGSRYPSARRWPSWRRFDPLSRGATGAFLPRPKIGVSLVLLQNLVDLGSRCPPCRSPWPQLSAPSGGQGGRTPSPVARCRETRGPSRRRSPDRWPSFSWASSAIGRGGASVSDDRDELHAHFEAFDPLRRAELATPPRRNPGDDTPAPAEPYFPLIGAAAAFAAHDSDPLPWLRRALERSPVNGRALTSC